MADRKRKFAAEKKRIEEEMEEIKQSTEVRLNGYRVTLDFKASTFVATG